MSKRTKIQQLKTEMTKIDAVKKYMSQMFNDNAKVIPYTSLQVVDDKDIEKIKLIEANTKVKLTGWSKGRGFSGAMKRWGFSGGPATHGSQSHRRTGSIGAQGYGRVLKGKKMPGRFGDKTITFDCVFLGVDENNMVKIKGAIPGSFNSKVEIYLPTIK